MYGKQLLDNTFASLNNQDHLTAIFFEGLILKAGVKRTIKEKRYPCYRPWRPEGCGGRVSHIS
jgi:hypothetical protein